MCVHKQLLCLFVCVCVCFLRTITEFSCVCVCVCVCVPLRTISELFEISNQALVNCVFVGMGNYDQMVQWPNLGRMVVKAWLTVSV
jgi:hypothetical protein